MVSRSLNHRATSRLYGICVSSVLAKTGDFTTFLPKVRLYVYIKESLIAAEFAT